MARARYQPQGAVRLDGRNRFVRGATVFPLAAYPASLGAAPGVLTTTSGATVVRGGPFGKAFATTSAAADYIKLGAIASMTTAEFTALVVVKLADLSSNPTIFESGSALTGLGSSNNSFQFRANSNGSLGAVKDNVADLGSSGAGAVAAGRYFVASISYGSGVMRIAVDGRSIYEVASSQTFGSGNFSLLTKDGTTSEKSAGEVALFAYWPRLMSTAEMASLTGAPLQLFDAQHDDVEALMGAEATDTPVSPAAGSMTLTGYAPSVVRSANINLAPAVAALAITGYAPSITQGLSKTISPAPASMTVTGYAPTVTRGASQTIPAGAAVPATLTLRGYAPTVSQANNLTPHYSDTTIMRLTQLRGTASLGPDRLQQTTGFP